MICKIIIAPFVVFIALFYAISITIREIVIRLIHREELKFW